MMKKSISLTILIFSGLLFSCCPEKNNQQARSSEVVQADSSPSKPVLEEKEGNKPEDDLELIGDCLEEEFGPT